MTSKFDKREIARKLVLDRTENIEFSSVGDHFWLDKAFDALPSDDQDALCRDIHDLMGQAVVTVTLPGDEDATTVAQILRQFADRIDAGPDMPLPPSIYSTLLREYAADLSQDGAA